MAVTTRLLPRREPDVIVVGAGTFGSLLAWRLGQDTPGIRTLVLESGSSQRLQHVQNAPIAEETVPPPRLLTPGAAAPPAGESRWRVPWRSSLPYHGLAYGVGGRSLFWGAYCVLPMLHQDGIRDRWPAGVVTELRSRYLPAAAEVLGLTRPVPHFEGPLNRRLRDRLAHTVSTGLLPELRPPEDLPDHPAAGGTAAGPASRLHMPVAIDAVGDAGSPRLVRFSSAPLLNQRLRDGTGDLELLTDCHVIRLRMDRGRVTGIDTSRGRLRVPEGARVVLAVGTIESARLLLDAAGLPSATPRVHGLTTHLRSNLTVRVPFPHDTLDDAGQRATAGEWGAAALHLRGSCRHPSGEETRFHHQITGFGVGPLPEAIAHRLYADTPRYDVEALDRTLRVPPRHLVVTLASVAEMAPDAIGEISLLAERDGFGARRAHVRLEPGPTDLRTWDAMDRSADAAIRALLGEAPCEVLRSGGFIPVDGDRQAMPGPEERREPLGCGHHEMGSLRMGEDPRTSHTDPDGRTHAARNLYAAGPALFPALDSAGPVLPGAALTLRLADHLRDVLRTECATSASYRKVIV